MIQNIYYVPVLRLKTRDLQFKSMTSKPFNYRFLFIANWFI